MGALLRRWRRPIMAFIGVSFLVGGVYLAGVQLRELRLAFGGAVTSALVTGKDTYVAFRNPDFCVLLYSFQDPRSGDTFRSSDGRDCASWPGYDQISVGDPVSVRYVPDDPGINGFSDRGLNLAPAAVSGLEAVLGVALLLSLTPLARRRKTARTDGDTPP